MFSVGNFLEKRRVWGFLQGVRDVGSSTSSNLGAASGQLRPLAQGGTAAKCKVSGSVIWSYRRVGGVWITALPKRTCFTIRSFVYR